MEKETWIDGDILPYRVGFVTQTSLYHVVAEGHHSSSVLVTKSKRKVNALLKACPDLLVHEAFWVESELEAVNTLKLMIKNIIQGCKGTGRPFKVCMSGETNFRTDIATIQPYKGNRKDFVKPVHFDMLREWLLNMPYTMVTDNEEADDLLSRGLMAGHTIATIDKDLNNTPGWHYNMNSKKLYNVTEEEAMRNFYTQMLTGDTADHIPGIKGIGPKKADTLFEGCETRRAYEFRVYEQYLRVYDDPVAAMTEVGQLLWMRREEDEMWLPEIEGGTT